jgi:hypothetical protein
VAQPASLREPGNRFLSVKNSIVSLDSPDDKDRMAIKIAICTLVSLFFIIQTCRAFPNGGPIDACVKAQPNRPNHGGTEPQSPSSNPFIVEASSDYYKPGDKITGEFLVSAPRN